MARCILCGRSADAHARWCAAGWSHLPARRSVIIGVVVVLALMASYEIARLVTPPEVVVSWDVLGDDGAAGRIRNATDHPLRGLSIHVWTVRMFTRQWEEEYARFPSLADTDPAERTLGPGEEIPFTISAAYVGRLDFPVSMEITNGARDAAPYRFAQRGDDREAAGH